MTRIYDKLVRDRIPEIIENDGGVPVTRILDNDDYFCALNQKLQEELAEYLEENCIEELADIIEVVMAIARYKGITEASLMDLRNKKKIERGGFEKRINLVRVNQIEK